VHRPRPIKTVYQVTIMCITYILYVKTIVEFKYVLKVFVEHARFLLMRNISVLVAQRKFERSRNK